MSPDKQVDFSDGSQNSIRFLVKASKRLSEQACYRYRKIATAQTAYAVWKGEVSPFVSILTGRNTPINESEDSLSFRFVESSYC